MHGIESSRSGAKSSRCERMIFATRAGSALLKSRMITEYPTSLCRWTGLDRGDATRRRRLAKDGFLDTSKLVFGEDAALSKVRRFTQPIHVVALERGGGGSGRRIPPDEGATPACNRSRISLTSCLVAMMA